MPDNTPPTQEHLIDVYLEKGDQTNSLGNLLGLPYSLQPRPLLAATSETAEGTSVIRSLAPPTALSGQIISGTLKGPTNPFLA